MGRGPQQGSKLTYPWTSTTGGGSFGFSVALSSDGNTALIGSPDLIGGPDDNPGFGAAWVFTRSGSTWTQQGSKLTGSGESGSGVFGSSVALSADGNTALIGGPYDNGVVGAAWVFTPSTGGPPLTYTWRIADRWGSYSGPGGATVPLYPVVAAPATFDVQVSACDHPVAGTYVWTSSLGVTHSSSTCKTTLALPPGSQQLTLTLTPTDGSPVQTAVQFIDVNDVLIVSMGDSVAAGEGNPDFPGQCSVPSLGQLTSGDFTFTDCQTPPIWAPQFPDLPQTDPSDPKINQTFQCHRSTHAGAAGFANDLQRSAANGAAHYSVSFVDVACSGASVSEGLLRAVAR